MILENISLSLQMGKAKDVKAYVEQALINNISAQDILNEGLIKGMTIIGAKFRNNEVYVPEVLIAARAMNIGLEVLKPALALIGVEPIGKALICTVKGDMHDIGKNLVKMMFEGQGILCIDLGVDVSSQTIIEAIKEHNPDLLCLSALLSTTMMSQKEIIEDIEKSGLRDKITIIVGGAPVTEKFAQEIKADAYGDDAASGAMIARRILEAKKTGNYPC